MIQRALLEHASTIRFLVDLETGFCVLTLRDYERMPATMMEARRIFKEVLEKYRKAHANDKP